MSLEYILFNKSYFVIATNIDVKFPFFAIDGDFSLAAHFVDCCCYVCKSNLQGFITF